MKRSELIVIALMAALLAVDFSWSLRSHALHQWWATLIYAVLLVAAGFFERRWVAKQLDQLKARYRIANVSMWIFLLLAIVSTIPNIFITTGINKTAFWPVVLISIVMFGSTFSRRHELLHELAEREKTHSM